MSQSQPMAHDASSAEIALQLNGDPIRCPAGLSLLQLLEHLGYRPQLVVVEFNGTILARSQWEGQIVVESDQLEVVTIVGGGS